jgi:hypothetical protein
VVAGERVVKPRAIAYLQSDPEPGELVLVSWPVGYGQLANAGSAEVVAEIFILLFLWISFVSLS